MGKALSDREAQQGVYKDLYKTNAIKLFLFEHLNNHEYYRR